MSKDYRFDIRLNKIDTMLKYLEANPDATQEEIDLFINNFELIKSISNYSNDDLSEFVERFEKVAPGRVAELKVTPDDIQNLSEVSPRSISVPSDNIKKLKTQRNIITAIASVAVIATLGVALHSCVKPNSNEVETLSENTVSENDTVVFTEMSDETKEYSDKIVLAMNETISKGFEVKETNKLQMSKKFINYMNIINMNGLTAEDWATYYQDGNVTAQDIMNDLWNLETVFEKIITVAETKEELIDFSLYFNETDAKLLNDAGLKIVEINTTTGKEKKAAIKDMHDYIIDNLITTENRMQYSEVALNTFRCVFVNAFDVLSNGKSITDEEEHEIFTVYSNCYSMDTSKMNVKDMTIHSLQSRFEIYMNDKIDTMLNRTTDEQINPYDSIDEMSKYVAENININLYRPAKDYEEYQEKLFLKSGNVTIKSKNDSGVSDGKGGVISSEQFAQYGIDPNSATAKAQLEAAVKAEYEAEAEKNKISTDTNGNVVDAATRDNYVQQGAIDYNRGVNNIGSVPELYKSAYQSGYDAAKANDPKNKVQEQPTTEYVPVPEQPSAPVQEVITEQPYVGDVAAPTEPTTPSTPVPGDDGTWEEFEPLNSEITTQDYTSSIDSLRLLKEELFALANTYTDVLEKSNTKC